MTEPAELLRALAARDRFMQALGMALDKATRIDPRRAGEVPSSKGIL